MKINADRLWNTHKILASFTEPERPYTRRSFTPLYKEARAWLENAFKELGLVVKYDAAGNLTGLYKGETNQIVAVGSHTDTVPAGGRFDGVSGVLSFLEVARCMRENNYVPKKSILGIDFLAEEPSEFGLSCIGSRLATGNFNDEMLSLRHNKTNQSLLDAVDEFGGNTAALKQGKSTFDVEKMDAYFELHIEQGPILEKKELDVGLVTCICSVTRYDFTIFGRADHAGNTPMDMRADAVVSAAKMIDMISKIAHESLDSGIFFTATVGNMSVYPNASNVIAKRVNFTLDIRSEDNNLVAKNLAKIFDGVSEIEQETNTKIEYKKISQDEPALSDEKLLSILENNAKKLDLKYTRLLSGAGHDAAYMCTKMPMAMIFIPCKGGRSHLPEESTTKTQLENGANLLLESLITCTS